MGRRNIFIHTLTLALGIGLAVALLSCGPRKEPAGTVAFIDEAFARLFPGTAAFLTRQPGLLARQKTPQNRDSASFDEKGAGYVGVASLPAYSEKALLDWRAGGSAPRVLIASPLAAARLIQALPALAFSDSSDPEKAGALQGRASIETDPQPPLPRLVVPFGRFLAGQGVDCWSDEYDYCAAYAELGRKAAELVIKKKTSASDGQEPFCLVIFQENMLRGKEALEAFARSFGDIVGEASLKVEVLPGNESSTDTRGPSTKSSPLPGSSKSRRPAIIVLGIDDAFAAGEAPRERGLTGTGQAVRAAFMADCGSWGEDRADRRLFAWRIEADEKKWANEPSRWPGKSKGKALTRGLKRRTLPKRMEERLSPPGRKERRLMLKGAAPEKTESALSPCAFYSGTEYFNASFLHCLHKLRKFLSQRRSGIGVSPSYIQGRRGFPSSGHGIHIGRVGSTRNAFPFAATLRASDKGSALR